MNDFPTSFPKGTDSVVIFEQSHIVSLETKLLVKMVIFFQVCLMMLLYKTMLSNTDSVSTICSGGNCHDFREKPWEASKELLSLHL